MRQRIRLAASACLPRATSAIGELNDVVPTGFAPANNYWARQLRLSGPQKNRHKVCSPPRPASEDRTTGNENDPHQSQPTVDVGVAGDLTAEGADRARALLAAIVASSEDAIVSKTLEGVVTSWNEAAERLFGFTATEMIGQSITRIIPEDRLHEEVEILTKLRNGERIERYETIRVRKDGQKLEISLTISPLRDSTIRIHSLLDSRIGLVRGDPNRLQQVLWNLLSNAIKFTSKGRRIRVVLERVNSHAEIEVEDNGVGIPADFLPYVFDRFRQADAGTTRRYGGLGLGLSIVKNLVELHGGSVRVKSGGEDQGSTFIVSLPIFHVRGGEREGTAKHEIAANPLDAAELPRLDAMRVLLIDDEADGRALVARILEGRGAQVVCAASGAEALETLSRGSRPRIAVQRS